MPTLEAILRASGRIDSVPRGQSQDNRSSTRSPIVHHAASAPSGAPGSAITGTLPMRAHGGGAAGLQREAMRDDFAACGQGR